MATKDVLIELVKHVLTAPTGAYLEPMPVPVKLPEDIDWDALYDMACKQGVSQIAGYALKWNVEEIGSAEKFGEAVNWAMALEGSMFFEIDALFNEFERAGIDYCPINGLVTKRFYPLAWMRVMDDADVLVRENDADKAKQIALSLGYESCRSTEGVAAFVSASRLYKLELHQRLPMKNAASGANVWKNLEPANRSGHRHEMSNIGQLIYILQRCQKHMNDGSIRVLSVLDFVLLRRALGLDAAVAREAVKRAGLKNTLETLSQVAEAWLDYGILDKKRQAFVDSIFTANAPQGSAAGILGVLNRVFKPFASGGSNGNGN